MKKTKRIMNGRSILVLLVCMAQLRLSEKSFALFIQYPPDEVCGSTKDSLQCMRILGARVHFRIRSPSWIWKLRKLRKHLPRGGKNADKCPIARLCTKPLQVKHPITIQDGIMEMALCSKITPAMRANEAKISLSRQDNPVPDCGTKLSFLSLCFNYLVFNAD